MIIKDFLNNLNIAIDNSRSLIEGLINHIIYITGQEFRPLCIFFDIFNKRLIIDYRHDDYMDIFGCNINNNDIQPYGNGYVIERNITFEGINIIFKTNLTLYEFLNHKLSKEKT